MLAVAVAATAPVFATPRTAHAQDGDDRRVVAVMRYYNNTGDDKYEHLGRAFSSMMISDLSVIDRIRLVERERIEELTKELDFQQSGYVDPESAQTVGMMIGAEWVVTGAFLTVDPEMRLDTRVANVESTEIVTTAEVTGQQESLFDLQQRLSDQVVSGLELALTEEEQSALRAQQEANRIDDLETMVKFSEALCLIDYGAYVEAADALQDVQSAAPGSAIVRATLGLMREKAEDEVKNAVTAEANRRIGGMLGRNRNPQPQRQPRPAECG
jgi:TolB-like protein